MYALRSIEEVFAELASSRNGLPETEIQRRIEQYGYNELQEKKRSLFLLFLKQFHSILVYILFAALALSIILPLYENNGHTLAFKDFIDAIAIGAILILNALLGFVQEKKAENAIAMLKAMSAPNVRVRRGSHVKVIPSRELVPGDILLLEEGDRVSADGRVILARNAAVDEASLTGESKPSRKQTETLEGELVVGDQTNMVFKGTVVTEGRMEVCVTGTGAYTELGKIASLVSKVEHPPTPLERSMAQLGRWLGIVVLIFCGVIFAAGSYHGLPLTDIMLAAASLAVSAVPEGLPAIVTVCLALGVQRMIKRRALTRELQAIETLGSVTVICTDKTGTITENEMEAQELWVDGEDVALLWGRKNATVTLQPKGSCGTVPHGELLLSIGASCNNAHSLEVGDPTEIGLLEVAQVSGAPRFDIVIEDQPFTSDAKYMMTTHEVDGEEVKYLKGAPEKICDLCTHVLCGEKEVAMDDNERKKILGKNEEMASRALRVLGMAYRKNDETVFVGLIGMLDPPRDGVKQAIATAARAGIRTVIITGDHARTAQAIARMVGVESDVVEGSAMETLSEAELQHAVHEHHVFARVSPKHKVKILELLQESGEIVAMGGDGVNDAPALKKAHVGFAMGKRGTDVARETAEMVLTDDHFATVVEAIEEGRTIYDNIRKFVTFLLRANFDELLVVLGAILIGIPLPYLPIHILLINLMTDSLPAMALALEKPEPNVMRRAPRDPKEHILHGEFRFIFMAAIIATIAAFHVFYTGWKMGGEDLGRTFTVVTSIMFELTLVFTCRTRRSLLSVGFFSNRYLLGAVAIAFLLLLGLLYTPIAPVVHLVPLTLAQWKLPLLWSFGALLFFEVVKVVRRR